MHSIEFSVDLCTRYNVLNYYFYEITFFRVLEILSDLHYIDVPITSPESSSYYP